MRETARGRAGEACSPDAMLGGFGAFPGIVGTRGGGGGGGGGSSGGGSGGHGGRRGRIEIGGVEIAGSLSELGFGECVGATQGGTLMRRRSLWGGNRGRGRGRGEW